MAQDIRIKRGTRAQIDTAMAASQLAAGEPYLVTDERCLAVGTGTGAYALAGKPTIDQIAGINPTLDLDFANQVYRHYSPATGLREKALSDIVTFTRASSATYFDAKGVLQSASSDEPRIDFDPVTGACKGLLIEAARTNLALDNDFIASTPLGGIAGWTDIAVIRGITLGKYTGGTARYRDYPHSNSQFVASAYFYDPSEITGEVIVFRVESHGTPLTMTNTVFNYESKSFSFSSTYTSNSVTDLGGGLYKISIAYSGADVTKTRLVTYGAATWLGGVQLEAGLFPTTYIPTTTTTATRAADVAKIDGTAFADIWNQNECSIFQIIKDYSYKSQYSLFFVSDGTLSNYLDTFIVNSIFARFRVRFSDMPVSVTSEALTKNDFVIAVALNSGTLIGSLSGAQVVSADTPSAPPTMNRVLVGSNGTTGWLNQPIGRFVVFPNALPSTTLQQLTAG